MKRFFASLLFACGGHVTHEATKPETLPPVTVCEAHAAIPGEKLAALHELIAPADWVEEAGELDGVWPKTAAGELREAWVLPGTICRAASWSAPIEDVTSTHQVFEELRAHLSGDDRVLEAKLERGRARIELKQERFCILHECRPPLSAPLTTFTICVDGANARGATATLMKRSPSLAPLAPLLLIEGLREQTATFKRTDRGTTELEITLIASPDAQTRAQEWLVSHNFGVRASWQVDSIDPRRSFILYPPEHPENPFVIWGR